jgi:hypothetical protein
MLESRRRRIRWTFAHVLRLGRGDNVSTSTIPAKVGDWLVLPADAGHPIGRRGQVIGLIHGDGRPPYRVRWLDDEHLSLVFPPPGTHVRPPTGGGGTGGPQALPGRAVESPPQRPRPADAGSTWVAAGPTRGSTGGRA